MKRNILVFLIGLVFVVLYFSSKSTKKTIMLFWGSMYDAFSMNESTTTSCLEMSKDTSTDQTVLSRFFKENINTIKRKSIMEHFDKSPYFCNIVDEPHNTAKGIKSKRKISGPQFRGFSNKDRKDAVIKIAQLDREVARIGNDIEESKNNFIKMAELDREVTRIEDDMDESKNNFLGFPKEEINRSIVLSNATATEVQKTESNMLKYFLGFSKPEQRNTALKLSNILDKCVEIRSNFYKSIDRRILLYHLKEEKTRSKKMVCSRYWPKPESSPGKLENDSKKIENISSKYFDLKSIKFDKTEPRKNGFKKESVKTESSDIKQEKYFMLEIRNLHKELRAIREKNISPSRDPKSQDAPFIQIKKELIMPCFVPPKSPHSLIEEDLYHDPWALLIATIFLNKTSGRTARPYIFWFLDDNPDPLMVLEKKVEELETYFGALGLQKTRAYQVWQMSHDFIYKNWKKVSDLYGVGRYGEDAFRMFCLGDFSFEPRDRYLRIYKAWYEMQEKNDRILEMNA